MVLNLWSEAVERYAHAKYAFDNYPTCSVSDGEHECYSCINCRVRARLWEYVKYAENQLEDAV